MWTYTGCCNRCVPMIPAGYWVPYPAYYPAYYPEHPPLVAKDIAADSSTATAQTIVGGKGSVFLSLEYQHDAGAVSPSVKVTIQEPTGSGIWTITTIPGGQVVKHDFAAAAAGATVKIDVAGCTARLTWHERI